MTNQKSLDKKKEEYKKQVVINNRWGEVDLQNSKKPKLIITCCVKCGKKYGTKKNKWVIGVWKSVCDICGKETYCASAPHDFGIYSNNEIRKDDELQSLI